MKLNNFLATSPHILVRKEHVMCARCATIEPVHPGDGTPLPSFVMALALVAKRHAHCKSPMKSPRTKL